MWIGCRSGSNEFRLGHGRDSSEHDRHDYRKDVCPSRFVGGEVLTTRVCLVRHGSTMLSVEDRFAGRTNAALSDQGREQARSLAKRLSKESLSAFYASPLDRTMETASILAIPHEKSVQPDPAFREIDHGVWEG